MTILMTADTIGGVWTYCMDLCMALQEYYVVVHLVTMGEPMKVWQQEEVKALPHVVVYETAYKLEWMQEPWQDVEACGRMLLQLEAAVQPDVVHLNSFAFGSLPFRAPVVVVAHSDVWSWFLEVKGTAPGDEWRDYFSLVQSGLRGADAVVAPTEAKLNQIKAVYGITDGVCIYNSREKNRFWEGEKQNVVFSMGRIWDEAKNTKLLLDASPAMEVPVRIAGEERFAQNNVSVNGSNVHFLGKLSTTQIANELAVAAIYVLPAKYEPFGLSALEAALSGCALVLGDIPTLREIWGEAAIFIDTNDAPALAAVINDLSAQPALCKEWGEKAKARAEAFSIEAMVHKYWQLYHTIIKEKIALRKEEIV